MLAQAGTATRASQLASRGVARPLGAQSVAPGRARMMPTKTTTPATSSSSVSASSRKPELGGGRVAAVAKGQQDDGAAMREPNLHPVLGVVNKGTIFLTSTPALNAFKSWFWGLFAGTYDEEEVAAELKALISSKPVVVFAWSFSPFSKNARELLDTLGASYEAVELDKVPRGFALKKELSKLTGRSSVPNVFIRGESVGGCYDGPGVVPLYRSGELQEKLRRAGALKKEQKGWSFF